MVQVITPYMGQKAEILGMMRKRGLMGVSVDTVDSYQGMERDIVMVSTVRSNSAGAVGFLKCAPLFFACPLRDHCGGRMTKGPASEQETAGGVLRYWDCCPGEVERREPLILWASETVWCSWVSFVSLTGGVGWGGPQRRAAIQRHDDARAARAHRAGRQPHVGVYIIKKEN
jgi:hypothetical protein